MKEEPKSTQLLPIGGAEHWRRPKNEWAVRLGVLVLLGALFLPNLGAFGLWDPWETHYGEVTRNMVESYDWISPWWGYRTKIGPKGKQGNYFYSKPIMIFWSEASAVRLIGFSEWAIRLPMALFALLSCFFAYWGLSRIWSRKVGLVAAGVMASCPQFFFLSRQAQTDMVFVAPLTVGLIFLLVAFFGRHEGKVSKANFIFKQVFVLGVFLLATIPQMVIMATDLFTDRTFEDLPVISRAFKVMLHNGSYHALFYGLLVLAYLAWFLFPILIRLRRKEGLDEEFKDRWIRKGYLLIFVIMCGVATLGKGLLGFCLPGAILFVYLLVTNRWGLLRAIDLPRCVLAFLPVALPWYVAMFVKHGNAFYARFFIHDHFNRLGTGVHQIDSGTFEHFLKWLGIGMFPWVAFVPFVLILLSRVRLSDKSRENQFSLMVFIWFFVSYLLFTLAKTKFHHYIFPALPPMAFLIGKSLANFARSKELLVKAGALLAIGLFLGTAYNLSQDEQMLRNLFTYKYDRPLPDNPPIDEAAPPNTAKPRTCTEDSQCGPLKSCEEGGVCSNTWASSQFYDKTTSTVRWALNQDVFMYVNFVRFMFIVGMVGLLLFLFTRTRWPAIVLLLLLGLSHAAWGLNYYLPNLSPHWSQKYVFEDYYALCGDQLEEIEVEAYTPLIKKAGLDSLYDYFGATSKRVCPYNITSWLIVWRGETYYSYNELMPLEKKNIQLRPYLEKVNPTMQQLPADCPVARILCPRKFYVFMENRKSNTTSSITSGVDGEMRKIRKDPASPSADAFRHLDKWEAERVHHENDFFTLFEARPVYKKSAPHCSCANAHIP